MNVKKRFAPKPQMSMIEGSIWKGLLSFTMPIVLGNMFQLLYNAADAFIVGNFLGKEALAAVSSSANLIHLMVGFINGMAVGAGILIAKYFGAKDTEKMRTAIHTNMAFGIIAGLVLTAVGVAFSPHILRLMNTPESVLPSATAYFRTYFYGTIASVVANIATGILQAVGDSRHPLYYLMISSVLNVLLDLLFVGGWGCGVASAAMATIISQIVSAVLCVWQLMRTRENYRLELRELRIDWPMLKLIVRFGFPTAMQHCLISFANVTIQANVNVFGDSAMAGYGSYSKIESFAGLPTSCFSMSLSTFVSQNLGAKQHDRVKKGARFGIICTMVVTQLVGVIIGLFAGPLVSIFNSDPEVVAFGVLQSRVVCMFYWMLAWNHCAAGILRGAGKATVPMAIMLSVWCALRVTYVTIMASLWPNIMVVYSAYPVTWSISSIAFLIYYLKVDWIHTFDRLEAQNKA